MIAHGLYSSVGAGHKCLFHYYSGLLLAAVRCGRYKLRFDFDPMELYDLEDDIAEQHPLANNTATWRQVVANITAARDAHRKTVVLFVCAHCTMGPSSFFS